MTSSKHQETATHLCTHLAIPANGQASQIDQLAHRLNLIDNWQPTIGSLSSLQILEIGCGQGDQTICLAHHVSSSAAALDNSNDDGHITAIDPGRPDYGSPFTLAQAQGHILKSELGDRISFERATAPEFFANGERQKEKAFDIAVLSHCLWYFPTKEAILETFVTLRKASVKKIFLAEWALSISDTAALPHLLAVLMQSFASKEEANVQSPLSPEALRELAIQAGWSVKSEGVLQSPLGMRDGEWEVYAAKALGSGDAAMECHRDALSRCLENVGGKRNVKCMDVWWAVLE